MPRRRRKCKGCKAPIHNLIQKICGACIAKGLVADNIKPKTESSVPAAVSRRIITTKPKVHHQ